MKSIVGLSVIIFFVVNTNYAQFPDTITVKTERIKGYGPFPRSFSFTQTLPADPEGTIIEKNLRASELSVKLSELLSK